MQHNVLKKSENIVCVKWLAIGVNVKTQSSYINIQSNYEQNSSFEFRFSLQTFWGRNMNYIFSVLLAL